MVAALLKKRTMQNQFAASWHLVRGTLLMRGVKKDTDTDDLEFSCHSKHYVATTKRAALVLYGGTSATSASRPVSMHASVCSSQNPKSHDIELPECHMYMPLCQFFGTWQPLFILLGIHHQTDESHTHTGLLIGFPLLPYLFSFPSGSWGNKQVISNPGNLSFLK